MKFEKEMMLLYAVTSRDWLNGRSLEEQVEETILGGATFVQLREKNATYEEFLDLAKKVKVITDKYKVPFVINDNIEVAIACDADGVHVGQEDMSADEVRKLIGANKIIGVSTKTIEQAKKAEQQGADYVGVGAVFPTNTKENAIRVDSKILKEIKEAISIPVVAIGGIKKENVLELKGSNIDGVAVVSAIFAADNITEETKRLTELVKEVIEA